MMKLSTAIKIVLTIAGGLGLLYGLHTYINAVDYTDSSEGIPFSLPLTLTTSVVWLGAVLELGLRKGLKHTDLKVKFNPVIYWRTIFKGTPNIVVAMALAAFIFGMVNVICLISDFGVTGIVDGKFVIHNHGQVIKTLTEKEFIIQKAKELKGITAIHILFLGMGIGILFPKKKKE